MRSDIYQAPTLPFQNLFYSNQRGGGGAAWALVPISYMPVTVVQPGLSTGDQSEGVGGGFPPPMVGIFFFVYENGFSLHIKAIV